MPMARFSRHKKGEMFGAYLLGIFLAVALILIPSNIGLKAAVSQAIDLSADTYNLEHYTLFQRVAHSPDSIFYTDPILQRTYTDKVLLSRFNEDTLEKLIDRNSRTVISFKITLKTLEDTRELFYNKNLYELIAPTASIRPKYRHIQTTSPVMVIDSSGRQIPGTLTISSGFERFDS